MMLPLIKKYRRTAVVAVLMAGVIASVVTGRSRADTSIIVLLTLAVVISASNTDYWRDRCHRAEHDHDKDAG